MHGALRRVQAAAADGIAMVLRAVGHAHERAQREAVRRLRSYQRDRVLLLCESRRALECLVQWAARTRAAAASARRGDAAARAAWLRAARLLLSRMRAAKPPARRVVEPPPPPSERRGPLADEERRAPLVSEFLAAHALPRALSLWRSHAAACAQAARLSNTRRRHALASALRTLRRRAATSRPAPPAAAARAFARWRDGAHLAATRALAAARARGACLAAALRRWRDGAHALSARLYARAARGAAAAAGALRAWAAAATARSARRLLQLRASRVARRLAAARALRALAAAARAAAARARRRHRRHLALLAAALRTWRARHGASRLVRHVRRGLAQTRRTIAAAAIRRAWRALFLRWRRRARALAPPPPPRSATRRAVRRWSRALQLAALFRRRAAALLDDRAHVRRHSQLRLAVGAWRRLLTDLPRAVSLACREWNHFALARGFVELARHAVAQTRRCRSALVAHAIHLGAAWHHWSRAVRQSNQRRERANVASRYHQCRALLTAFTTLSLCPLRAPVLGPLEPITLNHQYLHKVSALSPAYGDHKVARRGV
ncbi:hypothetical protein AB1Y20_020839 [Prymnesium parvum]